MQSVTQAVGGVLNLHAHLSFGSNRKPNSLHDAVSLPSVFLRRRKSYYVPKCVGKKESDESKLRDEMQTKFVEVYQVLKSELLNDPVFEWTHTSLQWVEQMMDYNVPRGKLIRGLSVINCCSSLKDGGNLSDDELFLASVLGWCIEWLQASFLIHDDIIDTSETRRGQPSWYKNPKVGNVAIIDGITLQSQVSRILQKHFSEKPYYIDLLNLFSEVKYQTILGQMMDTITTAEKQKDLLKYSFPLHHHIARYKTSCYSIYLPVACALVLAGENLDNHLNVRDLLLDIGIYFQVLDDYRDCFGEPSVTGKIGTDIETFKCSWLVLQALELCNEQQKKTLIEHYGKADPIDVAKVKAVYNEVDVHSAFTSYKQKSYGKLRSCVESHPSKAMKAIWKLYEEKIISIMI